jgi:hypothetical protein
LLTDTLKRELQRAFRNGIGGAVLIQLSYSLSNTVTPAHVLP